MAIGVLFFYLFLRQERRKGESDKSWKERGDTHGSEMMSIQSVSVVNGV